MARASSPSEGWDDLGSPETGAVRPDFEWAPDLPLCSRFRLYDDGDGRDDGRGCEGSPDPGVPAEGEDDGSLPWDRGTDLDGQAKLEVGRCSGPVVAGDPSCLVPEDVIGWGRLALELLIQAARDYDGRGVMETREDRADAYKFFFSRNPEYVHGREVWFTLAGREVPRTECEMRTEVRWLSAGGKMMRRKMSEMVRRDISLGKRRSPIPP